MRTPTSRKAIWCGSGTSRTRSLLPWVSHSATVRRSQPRRKERPSRPSTTWGISFGNPESESTGLKKKESAPKDKAEKVFVDLEAFEVPNDRTVIRIKVAEPGTSEAAERICKYIGTGDLLVVDMSGFDGTVYDRQKLTEILHSKARSENYNMAFSGSLFIITPPDVSLKKI